MKKLKKPVEILAEEIAKQDLFDWEKVSITDTQMLIERVCKAYGLRIVRKEVRKG